MSTEGSSRQNHSAGGVTPSERLLGRIATRTFLSPWSYSNLHTDEGRSNDKGDGKELCDLLVVFGKHVLIFSDKHCEFPNGTSLEIAWARWYRRAVEKSVRQTLGAKNWITRFPDRVFLDKGCQDRLPISLPNSSEIHFHLVVVTRGAYEACRSFFSNQSTGSLMINTAVVGNDHKDHPFTIGCVRHDGPFIHVLDELTLEVVLRELDTIRDLVDYFARKEEFFSHPNRDVVASGEEQLVAMYLTHMDDQGRHNFAQVPDDMHSVYIDEGHWEGLIENPQYRAKKEADKVSYAWDSLIEHLAKYSEVFEDGERKRDFGAIEPALRALASESRLARRQLSRQLLEAVSQHVPPGSRFLRVGFSPSSPDVAYVFLVLPHPPYITEYEEYREARRSLLWACCKVARLRATAAKKIVGIATEPRGTQGASEDAVLMDFETLPWDADQEAEALELQQKLGILTDGNVKTQHVHDEEFPEVEPDLSHLPPAKRVLERARLRRLKKLSGRGS